MNIPKITPMPPAPTPEDTRTNFATKAFALWEWLKNNIGNWNNLGELCSNSATVAQDAKNEAENARNEAVNAKNIAIQKANEIESYVIPTNATISLDTYYKNLDEIVRVETAQSIMLSLILDKQGETNGN